MHRTTPALIAVLSAVAACSGPGVDEGLTQRLRADVEYLASDKLEGRGTPSRGLDAAADYLEAQLREADVAPAVNGAYRQEYIVGSYSPADAKVRVRLDGKTVDPADYVFVNIGHDPRPGPIACDLVDAGNGIVMEDKDVDDLSALDLRGKAVVARKGAPWPLDPESVFGPDRSIGKVMAATVRGAKLLVYLSEDLDSGDAEASFFAEMKNAAVGFVSDRRLEHPSALNPILVLKPAIFKDAKRIEITIEVEVAEARASNVLGVIEGSDPALRDEWILVSAHYDHLGFHAVPEGQDGIWNGADDNASGTAAVLELARRLARNPGKRSVLVFFTSGEDRGILGSAFYSLEPVVPMDKVALQLNLDMIGRSMGSVEAHVHGAPALFDEAVAAGTEHGIEVIPDGQPSWRLVYLTDTYHFARAGVPSIFFFTGFHPDYHQPSDSADKIRYRELSGITRIAADLARAYADGAAKPGYTRPAWFVTP